MIIAVVSDWAYYSVWDKEIYSSFKEKSDKEGPNQIVLKTVKSYNLFFLHSTFQRQFEWFVRYDLPNSWQLSLAMTQPIRILNIIVVNNSLIVHVVHAISLFRYFFKYEGIRKFLSDYKVPQKN